MEEVQNFNRLCVSKSYQATDFAIASLFNAVSFVFFLVLTTTVFLPQQSAFGDTVYIGEYNDVLGLYGKQYKYEIIPHTQGGTPGNGWETGAFDHSGWSTGESPFSAMDNLLGRPVETYWPVFSDLFVYKEFSLAEPIDLTAFVAVDNGYTLYVNGNLVSSDYAEGFTWYWEYSISIPKSYLVNGVNSVALHLSDYGTSNAYDFALVELSAVPEPSGVFLTTLFGLALTGVRRRRVS